MPALDVEKDQAGLVGSAVGDECAGLEVEAHAWGRQDDGENSSIEKASSTIGDRRTTCVRHEKDSLQARRREKNGKRSGPEGI